MVTDSVSVLDKAAILFLSGLLSITCARKVYGRLVIIRERGQKKLCNCMDMLCYFSDRKCQ